MPRLLTTLLFFCCLAPAAPEGLTVDEMLARVSEEAEIFKKIAPTTLSEETLEQKSRRGVVKLLSRQTPDTRLPAAEFQTREVISEYGYAGLNAAPQALHEVRKVISIDGKQVAKLDKARETMTLGLKSKDDRFKKQMLVEFEKHGLHGAVTDFGQLILLFSRRRIHNYEFHFSEEAQLGADYALVYAFRQTGGAESLMIFRGRDAVRQPLQGEIWVRKSDGLPLRIAILAMQKAKDYSMKDEAAVDYIATPYGVILPVSVVHREFVNDELLTENVFHYAPFRKFASDTTIQFPTEEPAGDHPPAQR